MQEPAHNLTRAELQGCLNDFSNISNRMAWSNMPSSRPKVMPNAWAELSNSMICACKKYGIPVPYWLGEDEDEEEVRKGVTLLIHTHSAPTERILTVDEVLEVCKGRKHGTLTGSMDFETGGTKPPTGRGRHDVSSESRDTAGKWTKGGSAPAAKPADKDPHGQLSFDFDGDLTPSSNSEPKKQEKKMEDNMVMHKLPFRNGVDLDVEIDKPLENPAGRVVVGGSSAKIELNPDPTFSEKGITKIKSIGERKLVDGKDILFVETNKGRAGMLLASRPNVVALLDNKQAILRQFEARRNEFFAAEHAASRKKDQVQIDAMNAKAAELAKQIPEGNIPVEVKETSHFDGQDMYSAIVDGEPTDINNVTVHGWAEAIRPGATGSFASKCVASVSPEQVAKILSERKEESDKKVADTAKRDAENKAFEDKAKKIKASASCRVIQTGREGSDRDPFALVEMTDPSTGEKLQFRCRNIHDAGYTVNPTYSVAVGQTPGGLAITNPDTGQRVWQSFKAGAGWNEVRPLTPFENSCLDYLSMFPPISTGMRMS